MKQFECLGKTPGFVRYSGYDTEEEEAEFLPILGPVWCDGDPIPAELKPGVRERKPGMTIAGVRVPTKGALSKRPLLVGISSSSQQNVEQSFPTLCGGLNAGARFGCTQSRHRS